MDIKKTARIFYWLMCRDLTIFFRDYKDYLLNVFIFTIIEVGVFAYLLPYFGLDAQFGTFVVGGIVVSVSLFEAMHSATLFVDDLDNDRQITYDLTLPVSSSVIFIQRAFLYTCRMLLMGVFVIPLSKIIYWSKIDLSQFSLFKFMLIFLVFNLMYGFFGLWMISFIAEMDKVRNIWIRVVYPLWFIGGFLSSWQSIYVVSPFFSYFALFDPITYVMEGIRSTIMGSAGFLNFWICLGAIVIFMVLFAWRGMYLLRKRLDTV